MNKTEIIISLLKVVGYVKISPNAYRYNDYKAVLVDGQEVIWFYKIRSSKTLYDPIATIEFKNLEAPQVIMAAMCLGAVNYSEGTKYFEELKRKEAANA